MKIPIYIISKKYANTELDEEEKKHKYLGAPLALLVAFIWIAIMIFGAGILLEDVIYSRVWNNDLFVRSSQKAWRTMIVKPI